MSRRSHPAPWRVEPHPNIAGRWMVRDSAGGWVATCADEYIAEALLPLGRRQWDSDGHVDHAEAVDREGP